MRNLIQFLIKNSNFLLFILLEVVAFLLLVNLNPYQQSGYFSSANTFVASLNETALAIGDYFSLWQKNEQLSEQITTLQIEVFSLQEKLDHYVTADTTQYNQSFIEWKVLPAKVIDLVENGQKNYLTINKGSLDGIAPGQGVMDHDGVVGIVGNVSEHFAVVVPIVHSQTHLSCRLKKNNYICFTSWQGPNLYYARLSDVAKHVEVISGDSVVTSGLTGTFPEGIPVGIVHDVQLKDGESYYSIRLRLSVDYRRMEYVQVLCNPLKQELDSLNEIY